jgi:hypothetical protein
MATQALQHDQKLINCATCNAPWFEDDEDDRYNSEDGENYCVGDCLTAAKEKSYRRQVFESVERGIREAMKDIEALDKEFKDILPDVVDHPYAVLDDALMRATMFSEGKDSGWRDGLMLSRDEYYLIHHSMDANINSLSFSLRWDLGLIPEQPRLRIGEYTAGGKAKELAKLGQQLLNLKAWRERTERGVEA